MNTPRICKTHLTPTEVSDRKNSGNIIHKEIINNCKIIYVVRDGRDVITSQYYRDKKQYFMNIPFSQYIRNELVVDGRIVSRSKAWGWHVNEWIDTQKYEVHIFRYEDLINRPEQVWSKLESIIEIKRSEKFIDVRLTNGTDAPIRYGNSIVSEGHVARTSIYFKAGRIGDYLTVFNNTDLNFFYSENKDFQKAMKYLA